MPLALTIMALQACAPVPTQSNLVQSTGPSNSSDEQPIAGAQRFVIPYWEIDDTKQLALGGSADAALRLSQYYAFVTLDFHQNMYWLTIAAENGSPVGTFNLAQRLLSNGSRDDLTRAKFWFSRVVDLPAASESLRSRSRTAIDEITTKLSK